MQNQPYEGENCSLVEAAHRMGLNVVGSKPLCGGEGFEKATLEEMVSFALSGVDAVNIGSKNAKHIQEILDILYLYPRSNSKRKGTGHECDA